MGGARREIGEWGRRLHAQWISVIAFNSYFWSSIGKYLCIPVLNCYSCPVGTVACPIGSLSAFAMLRQFPFYIIGFVGMFGVAMGRALCGWACPFGLLQDGLYRIPSRKRRLPRIFNAVKYLLLIGLVIALPYYLHSDLGQTAGERISGGGGVRDYCSTICPAGSLESGLPYLIYDSEMRAKASWWSWTKIGLMVAILGAVVVYRRGFCRALCPLGAMMAFFSRVSLLQLKTDQAKCTRCMRCVAVCPTHCRHVPRTCEEKEATRECILCLDCVRNCPEPGALAARFGRKTISISQRRNDDK